MLRKAATRSRRQHMVDLYRQFYCSVSRRGPERRGEHTEMVNGVISGKMEGKLHVLPAVVINNKCVFFPSFL